VLAIVRQHGRDLAQFVVRPGSRLVRCELVGVTSGHQNYRTLDRCLRCLTSAYGYAYLGEGQPVRDAGLEVLLVGAALDDVPEYLRPITRRQVAPAAGRV